MHLSYLKYVACSVVAIFLCRIGFNVFELYFIGTCSFPITVCYIYMFGNRLESVKV